MRDLVDGDLVRLRIGLVQPILDVVGDVDESVAAHQHVVRLGHDVPDRPLGDRDRFERRGPRRHVWNHRGIVAQLAIAFRQLHRHRLLVCGRESRAVADHPVDHVAPHLGRALHPRELVALLVTERTLQHEVLLGRGITDVERAEPGVRWLRSRERRRVRLPRHDHGGRRFAWLSRGRIGVAVTGLAEPVAEPFGSLRRTRPSQPHR